MRLNFPQLAKAAAFLQTLDFKPWKNGTASGFYRRVIIVKDGLLGEVARYMADDYVVTEYESSDIERLKSGAKPESELMSQRWMFVQSDGANLCSSKHFWFGFRGGAHFYRYTLKSEAQKEIADLAYIVNKAAEIGDHGSEQKDNPII